MQAKIPQFFNTTFPGHLNFSKAKQHYTTEIWNKSQEIFFPKQTNKNPKPTTTKKENTTKRTPKPNKAQNKQIQTILEILHEKKSRASYWKMFTCSHCPWGAGFIFRTKLLQGGPCASSEEWAFSTNPRESGFLKGEVMAPIAQIPQSYSFYLPSPPPLCRQPLPSVQVYLY